MCSQRKTALAQGLKRQQEGNLEAANKLFQKAIQVTAEMAFKLIIALKNEVCVHVYDITSRQRKPLGVSQSCS